MTKWHRVGHRGAPHEFPANTLRSFQRAVEHGCTMVECDVRQAADGVLVLAHDGSVTDTAGQTFCITETESRRLQSLDLGAGEGVPTLIELVAWAKGQCAVMADMKCEGGSVEALVVETLAPLPIEAKLVPGTGEASRRRFRELDPALPLSLSLSLAEASQLEGDAYPAWLDRLDTQAVTWQYPLLTSDRITALHRRGVSVYAWTVDDMDTMQHLLALNVDGIISNRADLLESISNFG